MSASGRRDPSGAQGLPVEYTVDPVEGWRANEVVLAADGSKAWLRGVHRRRSYGPETTAVCTEFDHSAPASDCHCGLHCWPKREQAEHYRRSWHQAALCRVELSGAVIAHGEAATGQIEGYRGERMRTLGVEFQPFCARCAKPATELGVLVNRDPAYPGPDREAVRPVCGRCRTSTRLSLSDLASLLGTEVRFVPQGESGKRRGAWSRSRELLPSSQESSLATVIMVLAGMVAPVGVARALSAGLWAAAGLFALLSLAVLALVMGVITGRVGRVGWRLIGVLAAVLFLSVPLYLIGGSGNGPYRPERAVRRALSRPLPADGRDLRLRLEKAGAQGVAMAEVDEQRRAVRYWLMGDCHQVALVRNDDGTYSAVTVERLLSVSGSGCPVAYPLPASGSQRHAGTGATGAGPSKVTPAQAPAQELSQELLPATPQEAPEDPAAASPDGDR